MSGDSSLQMYEAQTELVETKKKLEKIQKENDELKNQMAINNLMKTVDDFQKNYSKTLEVIQGDFRKLTTIVSNHDDTFARIQETLNDLKEAGQIGKGNEKTDDHAKLSETVRTIQANVTTLSTKVCSSDKILSEINETLRKQNDTLEKPNKGIHILKKDIKTIDKETILLLGGWNGTKRVDSLLILQNNGENDSNWKDLNIKLPCTVDDHGAQFLNNYLYIFGGQNEKDEILNSTYKLTRGHKWLTNSLQWEKIVDMNEKRTNISNSSVILNDRIWVIGGWNGKALKNVEMYDPKMNIWKNKKSMNECRSLAAAAVVHGKIFCCGGYNGKNVLKSAECYDPSSGVWTLISDMPGPNGGCSAVVMDAHLIVIGGKASISEHFLNSVWVLDTTDKNAKWIEKEPYLSRPRCKFSTAKIDDKIFLCGGVYIDKKGLKLICTNDVEIFDGDVWRNGPRLTTYLTCAPAVVVPMQFAIYLK